jgi:hypothetical protein
MTTGVQADWQPGDFLPDSLSRGIGPIFRLKEDHECLDEDDCRCEYWAGAYSAMHWSATPPKED